MTNREQIMRLRGNEIQKVLCEVSTKDGVLALVGFGYEHYPEPSYFAVSLNGELLRDTNSVLYSGFFDTTVMYEIETVFSELNMSLLIRAVGDIEDLPW